VVDDVAELTVTIDDADPDRLRFGGNASGVASRAVQEIAFARVVPSTAPLILDVSRVSAPGPGFVELLNELARRAVGVRRPVVLEVSDDDGDWLTSAALSSALRVERTRPMLVAEKPRARPAGAAAVAEGVGRREGPGFVTSYGQERQCASAGCSTALSRYNSDALCAVHNPRLGTRRL